MSWEKKKVLVTVKAYPEYSKKYGHVVCIAGITDEGEWIRLYPMTMNMFSGAKKIHKYDWIEIECKRVTDEKLMRKESYKIRSNYVKIVDSSLRNGNWESRNQIILENISISLESLDNEYKTERTSLGIIKPTKLINLIHTDDLEIYKQPSPIQETLTSERIIVPQKIPHIFKYIFQCTGCSSGTHQIQCEDWELLEAYRKWGIKYDNVDILWKK